MDRKDRVERDNFIRGAIEATGFTVITSETSIVISPPFTFQFYESDLDDDGNSCEYGVIADLFTNLLGGRVEFKVREGPAGAYFEAEIK